MELYLLYQQYPWDFGETLCDLKAILTESFINCSVLTIVAFSGERFKLVELLPKIDLIPPSRYLAICHPLSYPPVYRSTKRTKRNLLIIWIVSLLAACPWAHFTKVNYLQWKGKDMKHASWCAPPFTEDHHTTIYMFLFSSVVFFIIPLFVVSGFYLRYRGILKFNLLHLTFKNLFKNEKITTGEYRVRVESPKTKFCISGSKVWGWGIKKF